jgi:hypothetical protein
MVGKNNMKKKKVYFDLVFKLLKQNIICIADNFQKLFFSFSYLYEKNRIQKNKIADTLMSGRPGGQKSKKQKR